MILDLLNLEEIRRGGPPSWVSGRNYQAGQCVRSTSDHQRYVRITNGAGAVDPATDTTNWRPDGGRAIKSVQRGVITLGAEGAPGTATISAVNPNKSELRYLGSTTQHGVESIALWLARVYLINSTTVGATAQSNNTATNVGWELTEYF